MALESLLYISKSKIEASDAQDELQRILATAHAFNQRVGITGALLFTGTHFAQIIEGQEEAISDLISAISRDERHTQITIVLRNPIVERRFPDWSMAYNGPSQFVSRHVTRLLADPLPQESLRAGEWLAELLEQFSGMKQWAA